MDATVLAGAAAKSFGTALQRLAILLKAKLEQSQLRRLTKIVQEASTAAYEDIARGEQIAADSLQRFLSSPDYAEICLETLLIRASLAERYQPDLCQQRIQDKLRLYVPAEASRTVSALLRGVLESSVDLAVGADAFAAILRSSSLRAEAHQRLVEDLLARIAAVLAQMSIRPTVSIELLDSFEKRYRAQVQNRYRKIVPPNFGSPRAVPFAKVYVPARLQLGNESVKLGDFLGGLFRAVVVGDPGGGKTTLSTKLMLDASSATGLFGRKEYTPLIVTLREYAARKQATPVSIVEFITETLTAKFQLSDVPAGFVQHLLSSGRAVVVFDGLDELTETPRRREIVEDVNLFCGANPTTPTLVTSRQVGYDQAPLDQDLFDLYTLAPFGPEEIHDYVTKWFANAPDLTADERSRLPALFSQESTGMEDLASNPLMLSLMCNLYRGERYIPRNRPELYDKCATMLFERWDKDRHILVPLPFKDHVRPAMMALAFRVFSDAALQDGIKRSDLVDLTAEYLLQNKYDRLERANNAAEKFVSFCTGRAWVFSNTGASHEEEVYQFTHRTFLEYFSAGHLVRSSRSSADLLKVLLPRIRAAEWDVVSQLAIQMFYKANEGAADELFEALLAAAFDSSESQSLARCNILTFCVRCLAFVEPKEQTVRRLVEAVVSVAGELGMPLEADYWNESVLLDDRASRVPPAVLLSAIGHLSPENQDAGLEGFSASMAALIERESRTAVHAVVDWNELVAWTQSRRDAQEAVWLEKLAAEAERQWQAASAKGDGRLWQSDPRVQQALFASGRLGLDAYLARVDIRRCLAPSYCLARSRYIAPDIYRYLVDTPSGRAEAWARWAARLWRSLHAGGPFFEYGIMVDALGPIVLRASDLLRSYAPGRSDRAEGARNAILLVAATAVLDCARLVDLGGTAGSHGLLGHLAVEPSLALRERYADRMFERTLPMPTRARLEACSAILGDLPYMEEVETVWSYHHQRVAESRRQAASTDVGPGL